MKKTKIFMSSLLSLSLLLSVVGCSKEDKGADKDTSKEVAASGQSIKALPDKLANTKVSVLIYGDEQLKAFAAAEKLFKEKYGGTVEYVRIGSNSEIEQKLVAAISAGDPMDLTQWSQESMPKYGMKNLLQPIDDYLDIKDSAWAESIEVMNQFKFKGKHYGFPNNQSATGIFFNKTMFENNGVKSPLDFYKEGTWNWDSLKKVAVELTMDTNRDGTIDQWGFGTNVSNPDMFLQANGADYASLKSDGGIELNIKSQNFINALQFFQDGFAKDKYIVGHKTAEADFIAGKIGMYAVGDSVFARNVIPKIKDQWDYVPFPVGPQGAKDKYPGTCSFWGIVNGAKNPEGAAALYYLKRLDDMMGRDSKAYDSFNATQKKYADRIKDLRTEPYAKEANFNEQQLQLMKETRKKIFVSTTTGIGTFKQVAGNMYGEIKNGTPVVNVIEKFLPLFQTEIDTMLKDAK